MSSVIERWASSGMAALTGPGDFSRAEVLQQATSVAAGIKQDGIAILTVRAGLSGGRARGRTSVGGGTRLLPTIDGWAAITLSRPSDLELLPALLESDRPINDPWAAVADLAGTLLAGEFAARGQLLGIPTAALGSVAAAEPTVTTRWDRLIRPMQELTVVDLSAMWAGPLCSKILADHGARVIRVESPQRPDGTRFADPRFAGWLNDHKVHRALDIRTDNEAVAQLLDAADVVIEASRPRALAQVGLDAASRPPRPGRVWVRITGYGPRRPDHVAFGDDAAVAGGLVGLDSSGDPVFCGDAIADPLTGLTAADAVLRSLARGGGELIDVAMAEVAATYAALPSTATPAPHIRISPPAPPALLGHRDA